MKGKTFEFSERSLRSGYPLVGSLLSFAKDPLKFIAELVNYQDTPIAKTRFLSRDVFVLTDPAAIEHVLVKQNRKYLRSPFMTPVRFILGDGLLTSEGKVWARQRNLSHEAFYHKNMDTYVGLIREEIKHCMARIDDRSTAGEFIDYSVDAMDLTYAIISRSLFTDKNEKANGRIRVAMDELLHYVEWYNLTPIKWPLWVPLERNRIFKRELRFLQDLAAEMIGNHQKHPERYNDLLSKLINAKDKETGKGLPEKEIRDQVLTFLLAGHETTAISACWILFHLATQPEQLAKVQAELAQVDLDGISTFEQVEGLKYTRQFIWESMRLRPPTWSVDRTAGEDDHILGVRIPKGSIVMIPAYVIHRLPKFWPDPLVFDPDRFKFRDNDPNDFTFIPFGGGARACVGKNFAMLESILITAYMAKHYTLEASSIPYVEGKPFITYRPRYGMWLRFTRRAA